MRPNPAGGRSTLVMLTPAARPGHAEAIARAGAARAALYDRLAPGTLAALLPRLQHPRAVMDALRD
mgnify:CR=1 FL=1